MYVVDRFRDYLKRLIPRRVSSLTMQIEPTIDILRSFSKKDLQTIIDYLNKDGIVFDESKGVYLAPTSFKKLDDECEDYLRKRGYKGGKLETGGKFFPESGLIYMLYDSSLKTYQEAIQELDLFAKKSVTKNA